jgi:rhodanese-related sulfurtransferase
MPMTFPEILFFFAIAGVLLFILRTMLAGPKITPQDALARLKEGNAVLIDVREPTEWTSGVVKEALLLPLSDLRGPRKKWANALKKHNAKDLLLYCRSGFRSKVAVSILAKEGFKATNTGGFSRWSGSGAVIVKP